MNEEERLRDLLVRYIEVVQQHFKGRIPGIAPEQVRSDCLYVVDWRAELDDCNSIKIEQVNSVINGIVQMPGSITDCCCWTVPT